MKFGLVGATGFLWDTGTVYMLRPVLGLYAAGTAGFVVAATANWILNRLWTFRHHVHESASRQWLKFMVANGLGFIVNRGMFFILISLFQLCRTWPVLAIIAGTIAGLGFNYKLSKRFVFHSESAKRSNI
jgi:putative flippase GtrA